MIRVRSRTWLDVDGVRRAVAEASIDPLEQCALVVEREAKILTSKGGKITLVGHSPRRGAKTLKRGAPSRPGTPPHRQSGVLSGSISYSRTIRKTYVVGPTSPPASYGAIHEFGGRHHPPRPFMWPALVRSLPRFPGKFRRLPLRQTRAGRKTERDVARWQKRWGGRVR